MGRADSYSGIKLFDMSLLATEPIGTIQILVRHALPLSECKLRCDSMPKETLEFD